MADSAPHVSAEELERIALFLQRYSFLHAHSNIRFFADQQWKEIPPEWISFLSQLNNKELGSFASTCSAQVSSIRDADVSILTEECPPSLRRFVEERRQLKCVPAWSDSHLPRGNFFPEKAHVGVKLKKEHELQRLATTIATYAEEHRITRIIDVGCGMGHLLSRLCSRFFVIGVDADEYLCTAGKHRYESVKFENLRISEGSIYDERVQSLFSGTEGERTAIVSLHGCGDLQPLLLRLFSALPRNRVPVIFLIPCCYHKMSHIESGVDGWAMSDSLKNCSLRKWCIQRSAFRLACQQQLCSWSCDDEERSFHKTRFLQRALLEVLLLRKGNYVKDASGRRIRRSFPDLESVGAVFAQRLHLPKNEEVEMDMSFRELLKEHAHLFDIVEPFNLLQAVMQQPLESLVLWDRVSYLKERGLGCLVKQVFDSALSPRCYCIIGFSLPD